MNDREKAIVMAHTGICMLTGEKLDEFYRYLAELFDRPIYTHELLTLENDIREKAKPDFIKLCKEEPERKTGRWIDIDSETYTWKIRCDKCGHERSMMSTQGQYPKFCEDCGAKMEVEHD